MTEVSRSYDFNIYYQRTLLHRVLSDKKYAGQAIPLLKEDVFDSEPLKWVCRQILKENKTVHILVSELKKVREAIDEDLRKAIVSDLKEFNRPFDADDSEYAIENLREFVESQDVHESIKNAAIKAEAGAKAAEVREALLPAVHSARSLKNKTINPFATFDERFAYRKKLAESGDIIYTSSGFKHIDEDIGGPRPGELWAYFGDTNLGKSQAAVAAGKSNVLKGFKVLHFSLEDILDDTLQRYDATFTRIVHDKLTWSRFNDNEIKIIGQVGKILNEKRGDFLRVSKVEEGSTMDHLYAEYRRLQIRDNFYPQVVLIDSPHDMDCIRPMENYRLSQKRLYKEIREFGRQENVSVIIYDQSKQEVKGKIADTSAASESYDKARIVDGFITMNQTKLQKKDHLIELFTAKMRSREKHRSYLVQEKFKISSFICIQRTVV